MNIEQKFASIPVKNSRVFRSQLPISTTTRVTRFKKRQREREVELRVELLVVKSSRKCG